MTRDGSEERERELKLGIPDESGLGALLEALGGRRADAVAQVNHFFDTPTRALRSRAIGFRLRQEGGAWTLTVKGPSSVSDGGLSDRVEVERPLDPGRVRAVIEDGDDARALLGDIEPRDAAGGELLRVVRAACADEPLQPIGAFRNERIRVDAVLDGGPVVVEFDRTDFGGGHRRYEVELEIARGRSAERLAAELEALFQRAGVEAVPTTSKLAHFLELQDRRG